MFQSSRQLVEPGLNPTPLSLSTDRSSLRAKMQSCIAAKANILDNARVSGCNSKPGEAENIGKSQDIQCLQNTHQEDLDEIDEISQLHNTI